MAIGAIARNMLKLLGGGPGTSYPGSGYGGWQTLHDNVSSTVTAETGAVLIRPLSATTSSIHVMRMGPGMTRFIPRLRYPQAVLISTTQPVIRFFSIYADPDATSFADDGTVKFLRLDNASHAAVGLTFTVAAGSADARDTTYRYSNIMPDLDGIDAKGGTHVISLVETAGVITTGSGAITLEALGIN